MTTAHALLNFIDLGNDASIAEIVLNRPEQANAFSVQMMNDIIDFSKVIRERSNIRAVLIKGTGKHFSAGADLNWMKTAANLSYEDNVKDAQRLRELFECLDSLMVPVIAAVQGAIFGGAVGLVACSDIAIAHSSAKFCLSEAKLGLLPAVIAPYLMRKIRPGTLKRMALTGLTMGADEALAAGLIEVVTTDIEASIHQELNSILSCGPEAQKAVKKLFSEIRDDGLRQSDKTVLAISTARTSVEGQAGLSSFFARVAPPWIRTFSGQKETQNHAGE